MTENFPKLMSDTNLQIQEAQRIPNKTNINTKQYFPKLNWITFKIKNLPYLGMYIQTAKSGR
jgi:hypothetical protein